MLPKFYKCNLGHFVFYKFVVLTTFIFKEDKGKITINRLTNHDVVTSNEYIDIL
jgi:hypothetical protein